MSGRPGPKHKRPVVPRKRNDLGGRIDMPNYRHNRGGYAIEQEGPRIGWMRAIEPEVPDDSDHHSQ